LAVVVAREGPRRAGVRTGRLGPGMGGGGLPVDYGRAGIPLDPPRVRIARLAESVAILKGLWGEEPFSFAGEHYTVAALDGDPKPIQRPRPPLVIGGGAPKVLAFAAREADIVGINANQRAPARRHPQRPEYGAIADPLGHGREGPVGARRRGRAVRRPRDPDAHWIRALHRRREPDAGDDGGRVRGVPRRGARQSGNPRWH